MSHTWKDRLDVIKRTSLKHIIVTRKKLAREREAREIIKELNVRADFTRYGSTTQS